VSARYARRVDRIEVVLELGSLGTSEAARRLRDSGRYGWEELSCGIVRVVVSKEPFVNESNRDVQDDVRSILFG
jgi:hypothetical protein